MRSDTRGNGAGKAIPKVPGRPRKDLTDAIFSLVLTDEPNQSSPPSSAEREKVYSPVVGGKLRGKRCQWRWPAH